MSEAKHTPGRLTLVDIYADHEIRTADGLLLAVLDARQRANAKRLIACWNALEDLPQDALVGGWTRAGLEAYGKRMEEQRDELLAELTRLVEVIEAQGYEVKGARALIAKATGSAA